jgi:arabinogalactan endo-1,4-beta-galactosidase
MNKLAVFTLLVALFHLSVSAQTTEPAAEIVVTPYKTTMLANGKDEARIKITAIDKNGKEVNTAQNQIDFVITGDASITTITNGKDKAHYPGKAPHEDLYNGQLTLILKAGKNKGIVKFEATAAGLKAGSTEIHTIQPGIAHPVTTGAPIAGNAIIKDKILGADISFLPQLESRGIKFTDINGKEGDAIQILKYHGFNYIRLRIFDHPEQPKGYSPNKGFCDLPHTLQMAKRIKDAGMKFLLDFHYSDTWADPQRQDIPQAWAQADFKTLTDSVYTYTKMVLQTLKGQGTLPDMVQIGNEINHGMIWPDGAVNNLDSLATLIYAGVRATKEVDPQMAIMLHIALGGQNDEARFFIDNMLQRKVPFDVIGLSYYPKWHGTPADLQSNMADLARRYHKYVMVAEYSQLKQQVNDIAFTAPGDKALGSFIWEPLNTWESVFDKTGKANQLLDVYPGIAKKYNVR